MKEIRSFVSRDEDGQLTLWIPGEMMAWSMNKDNKNLQMALKEINESEETLFYRCSRYDEEFSRKTGKYKKGVWNGHLMFGSVLLREEDLPRMINPNWEDERPIEVELIIRPKIK